MFYGQNNQDSLRCQQKSNNLIVDTEPFEEYNDLFLNQSLSEGFFSIDMNNQNKKEAFEQSCRSNEEEVNCIPPLSIKAETQSDLFSFPQTPNPKLLGQQLFTSTTHKEIDSRKYSYTSSLLDKGIMTHTRNVYQNLYQYFLLKTFIKKLTNKKKMNSSFNQYHFNVINDRGSVMNMKLFKDNALRIKPLRSQSNRSQEIYFRQIVVRPITKWMGQIYIKTNQIIERIPIFYPESMQKLIWDGFIQIARIYFMFMIPLDLSFNQEQFMFGYNYKATVVMIMMLLFDLLVSFNTAHYKQGQIVTDRQQIARNVIAKSGGLELLSVSLLVVIWSIKQYQVDYTVDASIQLYQLGLMIFFIQYKNISKFIRQVEQAMNLSKSTKAILELLKLIIGVIVVLHVFPCLWYWVNNNYEYIRQGTIRIQHGGILARLERTNQ